jgi:hypothetical protein
VHRRRAFPLGVERCLSRAPVERKGLFPDLSQLFEMDAEAVHSAIHSGADMAAILPLPLANLCPWLARRQDPLWPRRIGADCGRLRFGQSAPSGQSHPPATHRVSASMAPAPQTRRPQPRHANFSASIAQSGWRRPDPDGAAHKGGATLRTAAIAKRRLIFGLRTLYLPRTLSHSSSPSTEAHPT